MTEASSEKRVSFLGAGHRVAPLEPLLDSEALQYARRPQELIIKTLVPDGSLDFRFFSDPALREPKKLLQLIKVLTSRGIVGHYLFRKSIVGVFAVSKKGGKLRLVFDGRGPNACFNVPPKAFSQPQQP